MGQFKLSCGQIRFFWLEIHFLEISSQHFVTIMMVHQQGNIFVLTAEEEEEQQGLFLAQKSALFYATPINPHFLGSDRPNSIGVYLPNILR